MHGAEKYEKVLGVEDPNLETLNLHAGWSRWSWKAPRSAGPCLRRTTMAGGGCMSACRHAFPSHHIHFLFDQPILEDPVG